MEGGEWRVGNEGFSGKEGVEWSGVEWSGMIGVVEGGKDVRGY